MERNEVTVPAEDIPLAVITAREPVTGNPWITERWRVLGVVAGEAVRGRARARTVLRDGPEGPRVRWTGFALRLRKSEADSYYYNLIGTNPSMYVFAHCDESGEPIPTAVGLDYIEAMAHREAGNETFAVPMPPEVYRRVERFVLEHYEPEEPRMQRKHDDAPRAGRARRHDPED